jgi:hypothetical protein
VLGTLTDSALRIIGADGTTQLAFNDNATGLASLIHWTATADGKYFVEVSGVRSAKGTYDVSVTRTGLDDHGNTAATATQIAIPSTTPGNIEVGSDLDWFKFNAISGAHYSFETSLGSLLDSTLELIDKNGVTQLALDDDSGVGLGSRIDWTAPSSGTYFLIVRGFSGAFGTYTLQASTAAPGSGSLLLSLDEAPQSDGASMAASSITEPAVAFDLIGTAVPASPATGSRAARSAPAASSAGDQDAALVAWLQTLATRDADSSLVNREDGAANGDETTDFWSDADSVFEEIGASAVKVDCAV